MLIWFVLQITFYPLDGGASAWTHGITFSNYEECEEYLMAGLHDDWKAERKSSGELILKRALANITVEQSMCIARTINEDTMELLNSLNQ